MLHDPSDPTSPAATSGRLRRLALTGAAAALLGAAGLVAFDARADQPIRAFNGATLYQTAPGSAGKDCPEGLGAATLLSFGLQEPADTASGTTDPSVADVVERANPAVVTVINRMAAGDGGFFPDNLLPEGEETLPIGAGSGFIIDAEGRVVTNDHVVQGADELEIQFFDGTETTATVVGRDEFQDIAVLQLDLAEGQQVPGTLSFGDSDAVRAGDDVIAIGSSLGEFTNTVSTGIVGALDRSLGSFGNLIQHDAEIYQGNSGGPLLNMAGEVIGINAAGISDSRSATLPARLAFAIESNAAREVVDELIATGVVRRPFIGITGGQVDGGHFVQEVEAGTPAAAAGLQTGDVIVAFDGAPLTNSTSLFDLLYEREPGESVTLTIDRGGDEQEVALTLGERPLDAD